MKHSSPLVSMRMVNLLVLLLVFISGLIANPHVNSIEKFKANGETDYVETFLYSGEDLYKTVFERSGKVFRTNEYISTNGYVETKIGTDYTDKGNIKLLEHYAYSGTGDLTITFETKDKYGNQLNVEDLFSALDQNLYKKTQRINGEITKFSIIEISDDFSEVKISDQSGKLVSSTLVKMANGKPVEFILQSVERDMIVQTFSIEGNLLKIYNHKNDKDLKFMVITFNEPVDGPKFDMTLLDDYFALDFYRSISKQFRNRSR